MVGDGFHAQPVRADHAGKAKLAAQTFGQHRVGKRGRQAVLGGVGGCDVCGHDHIGSGRNAGLKGQQFHRFHLFPCLCAGGSPGMAILKGVSVSGEMFQRAEHPGFMEALHRSTDHPGGDVRVGGKGAAADDRVQGVGVDIGDGGKVQIEAVMLQVAADGASHGPGLLGIAGGADGGSTREFRQVEGRAVCQTCHRAALFIHRDQKAVPGGTLKIPDQCGHLGLAGNIGGKQHDTAHRVGAQMLPHGAGQLHAAGALLKIQRFRPHGKQLAYLFPQSHGGECSFHFIRSGSCRGGHPGQQCQTDDGDRRSFPKLLHEGSSCF